MSSVAEINEADFESTVLQAQQSVLVYFWADWCGPCRLVKPSIEWAANHYGDRLKVVKVEVDGNPEIVKQYKVEGIPALRLFQNSQLVEQSEGAITRQQLAELLDSHLQA